ncbi:hypothetical protein EDB87DRAFT_908993 [Lactarius vividus]|nr:hypothetical protein EDB87DRAFT_908993 [Lactarius vividus]
MAKLIRSAKSASDWTRNELAAYNITVGYQDAATFFVTQRIAMLLCSLIIWCSLRPHQRNLLSTILLWYCCMRWATLGVILTKDVPLVVCGENRNAKVDMCVFDVRQKGILRLVQENKRHMSHSDPEPRLIAKAIASFAANIQIHQLKLNQPPLHSKVMAGIDEGHRSDFLQNQGTAALTTSIQGRACPQTATTVYAHAPRYPRPDHYWSEGMQPLDNRQVILSCLSNS